MADFADITAITKKALQAIKFYYDCLDAGEPRRRALLDAFYPDPCAHALMEWNGYAMTTRDEIWGYLSTLPKTKHDVKAVDAQPLPGNTNADSFFATVHGTCTYDDEHVRHFFQRFVLCVRGDGKVYIVQDYLRWTGEE